MAKIRVNRKAKKGGAVTISTSTTRNGIREDIVGTTLVGAFLVNVPTFRRPNKGSPEARERKVKIRGMPKGKRFLGNLAHELIHTGLPIVGSRAGDALGGPVGGLAGSMI